MIGDYLNAIYYCSSCICHIDPVAWNEGFSLCKTCSSNILPFNHLDEQDFQSALLEFQYNSARKDRLEDLHFNIFKAGEIPLGNGDLDPDVNFFQNCSNLQTNYYEIDEFVNSFKDDSASEATFSCIHFNSRSVHKNFDKISAFINLLGFDFDVIGLCETWLKDTDNLPNMPDYNSVCCNRCEKSGGGVGLYIRNSLSFIKRSDLISDENIYESDFV